MTSLDALYILCIVSLKRTYVTAPGPEIVHFWGLGGPLLPQNPLEKVEGAPTFQRFLWWEGAV